jgi:hypothetical protein
MGVRPLHTAAVRSRWDRPNRVDLAGQKLVELFTAVGQKIVENASDPCVKARVVSSILKPTVARCPRPYPGPTPPGIRYFLETAPIHDTYTYITERRRIPAGTSARTGGSLSPE